MAIGVNARTAFSLLFPQILDEYGWDRGVVAGFFSFGFFISAFISPFVGRLMDLRGPRVVVESRRRDGGARARARSPRARAMALYADPRRAGRRRRQSRSATACIRSSSRTGSCAAGASRSGSLSRASASARSCCCHGCRPSSRRTAGATPACCSRRSPRSSWCRSTCCCASGRRTSAFTLTATPRQRQDHPADTPATSSTPRGPRSHGRCRARMRTARFWWIGLGYFCMLYAWYAVQVHQTKYLIEIGVSPMQAAWALGLVSLFGVPGQIVFGYLSDRIGREWTWAFGCGGFAICYLALIALPDYPTRCFSTRWSSRRAFSATRPPRCSDRSSRRFSRGRTSAPSSGACFSSRSRAVPSDLGHRHPVRSQRRLRGCVLARLRAEHRGRHRDRHRGAAQGAAGGGAGSEKQMSASRRPPSQRPGFGSGGGT